MDLVGRDTIVYEAAGLVYPQDKPTRLFYKAEVRRYGLERGVFIMYENYREFAPSVPEAAGAKAEWEWREGRAHSRSRE